MHYVSLCLPSPGRCFAYVGPLLSPSSGCCLSVVLISFSWRPDGEEQFGEALVWASRTSTSGGMLGSVLYRCPWFGWWTEEPYLPLRSVPPYQRGGCFLDLSRQGCRINSPFYFKRILHLPGRCCRFYVSVSRYLYLVLCHRFVPSFCVIVLCHRFVTSFCHIVLSHRFVSLFVSSPYLSFYLFCLGLISLFWIRFCLRQVGILLLLGCRFTLFSSQSESPESTESMSLPS
jgi:hypothetical protein